MLHRDRAPAPVRERWISGGRALRDRDRYDRDQWITSDQPQSGEGWMSSDTKSESGWIYRWILILRATLVLVWVLRWFSYKLLSSDRAQTGVVEGSVEVSHCESTHCVIQVSDLTESSYRVVSPRYLIKLSHQGLCDTLGLVWLYMLTRAVDLWVWKCTCVVFVEGSNLRTCFCRSDSGTQWLMWLRIG